MARAFALEAPSHKAVGQIAQEAKYQSEECYRQAAR